jgi:hypothetical protein
VDASLSAASPFSFQRVYPSRDQSFTSHSMSPAAVLEACRQTLGEPPEAWALGIRGERFELGDPLSPGAALHLRAALRFFFRVNLIRTALKGSRTGQ